MPTGFRDLSRTRCATARRPAGYLLFLTDRYPDADPREPAAAQPTPRQPVTLRVEDDLRRSRLTVFFRLLLDHPALRLAHALGHRRLLRADPRLVRDPDHRAGSRRRCTASSPPTCATDPRLRLPLPGRQPVPGLHRCAGELSRSTSRSPRRERAEPLEDALPALPRDPGAICSRRRSRRRSSSSASSAGSSALALGRMPEGLRNLGAYCLRYSAQTYAYAYLLTDSYPYSGPTEYVEAGVPPHGPARCGCRRSRRSGPRGRLGGRGVVALADLGSRRPPAAGRRAGRRARAAASSTRHGASSASCAGATSPRRSCSIGAFAVYARYGVRFAKESAAGRIGTGMLLGHARSRDRLARPDPVRDRRPLVAAPARRLRARLRRLDLPQLVRAGRRVPVRLLRAPDRHGPRRAARELVVDPRRARVRRPRGALHLRLAVPDSGAAGRRRARSSREADRLAEEQGLPPIPVRIQEVDVVGEPERGCDRARPDAGGSSSGTRSSTTSTTTRCGSCSRTSSATTRSNHLWKSIAWYALFALPGAFLIAWATRRRGGMREPAAVPLALLVLVVLQFLALPVQNAITRNMEAEADWVALETTEDPEADDAASGAASPTRRRPTRARRPGRTSSWTPIRRWRSASRWPRPGASATSKRDSAGRSVGWYAGRMARSVIVSAVRTPFGKLGGALEGPRGARSSARSRSAARSTAWTCGTTRSST